MIEARAARDVAAAELRDLLAAGDAMFAPWPAPAAGEPVAVHDLAGPASYWLVPLVVGEHVIGAVRVGAQGRVMTIGISCRTPHRIASCPRVVTGLTADEAAAKARAEIGLAQDETPMAPRFVHDGPPGREAWLVETIRSRRPSRWILVTQGGCTARQAGARMADDPGVE